MTRWMLQCLLPLPLLPSGLATLFYRGPWSAGVPAINTWVGLCLKHTLCRHFVYIPSNHVQSDTLCYSIHRVYDINQSIRECRALKMRAAMYSKRARRLSSVIQRPFDLYKPGAYDLYLLGMVNQLAMAMDSSVTEEVTNHLFQPPDSEFGRDLAATNLGRGRENGVPGINRYRRLCGLPEINSWGDMHHHIPNSTVSDYHFMYSHPDDVDLWSAGVSERPQRGSIVGPTFNCLIALTFQDLKRGDRFWYENGGWPSSFTPEQLRSIKSIRLSRLICDSSDTIETVQMRAMEVHHFKTNPRVACTSNRLPRLNLTLWKEDKGNEDFEEAGFNKPGAIIEETDNLENNVLPPENTEY